MKWKILGVLGAMMMIFGGVLVAEPTWAADSEPVCKKESFLGFRPWYDGLVDSNCELVEVCAKDDKGSTCDSTDKMELQIFIWIVVLNVLFDLGLAVGLIAVGIVIYGGYLYIMSQGDPGRLAKGKKTLISAVIGIVIAMSATVIVNTLKVVLGISGNGGWQTGMDVTQAVKSVFDWAYIAAGIVAVGFIVKNGIDYMISVGDPGKIQKATKGLVFAVVGLVIVILAAVLTNFIVSSVGGAA